MPQSLRHAVKGGYSLSQKRISPFGTPRERLRLAVSGLRKSLASGMEMLARSVAAFRVATRLASAPTIRCCTAVGGFAALRMRHTPCGCRSAHLVEVLTNFRLPIVPTNAASAAMPLFRTQSAAEQTSLAPNDSKARLQSVTTRRKFMAKPCTPHPHCAARAVIQAANSQCTGSRGRAPCVLLGVQGGHSLT